MRQYKRLLKNFLRDYMYDYRKQHSYSQEHMAELLHISPRSYSDQEHGKYSPSALTLMFFLLLLTDEEALLVLHRFKEYLHKEER